MEIFSFFSFLLYFPTRKETNRLNRNTENKTKKTTKKKVGEKRQIPFAAFTRTSINRLRPLFFFFIDFFALIIFYLFIHCYYWFLVIVKFFMNLFEYLLIVTIDFK